MSQVADRSTPVHSLPYGTEDLDSDVATVEGSSNRVRCYIRGCRHTLQVPGRGSKGEVCPEHGIRCHYSRSSQTYTYSDVRRNIIASPEQFARRIVRHPFKYESHRLGSERSEDALSWNVFRSLQEAGCLSRLARLITGDPIPVEPFLYLWGICTTDDDFTPWDLLIAARRRFEANLPVDRPMTEPDIAVHLPGRYLILIEAKFTSANTYYGRGVRKDNRSLTMDELVGLYQDRRLKMLNVSKVDAAERIYQQLWRNVTFAEWMAGDDHPRTKAFHVNLVRQGYDEASAKEFHGLVRPEFKDRFQQLTWEQVYGLFRDNSDLTVMRRYLETKTAGLRPAFRF